MQSANLELHNLYTFTKLAVARHRRDARSGRKEEASQFVKFVRNSRIIELLRSHDLPAVIHVNVPLLEWELSELEKESDCNTTTNNESDLSAIRSNLDLIAAAIFNQSMLKNRKRRKL